MRFYLPLTLQKILLRQGIRDHYLNLISRNTKTDLREREEKADQREHTNLDLEAEEEDTEVIEMATEEATEEEVASEEKEEVALEEKEEEVSEEIDKEDTKLRDKEDTEEKEMTDIEESKIMVKKEELSHIITTIDLGETTMKVKDTEEEKIDTEEENRDTEEEKEEDTMMIMTEISLEEVKEEEELSF